MRLNINRWNNFQRGNCSGETEINIGDYQTLNMNWLIGVILPRKIEGKRQRLSDVLAGGIIPRGNYFRDGRKDWVLSDLFLIRRVYNFLLWKRKKKLGSFNIDSYNNFQGVILHGNGEKRIGVMKLNYNTENYISWKYKLNLRITTTTTK